MFRAWRGWPRLFDWQTLPNSPNSGWIRTVTISRATFIVASYSQPHIRHEEINVFRARRRTDSRPHDMWKANTVMWRQPIYIYIHVVWLLDINRYHVTRAHESIIWSCIHCARVGRVHPHLRILHINININIYLSIYLSIYLFVYLSIYLSIYLPTYAPHIIIQCWCHFVFSALPLSPMWKRHGHCMRVCHAEHNRIQKHQPYFFYCGCVLMKRLGMGFGH